MAWYRKPAWGSVWKEVFQHWWKLFSQTRPLAKFNSQIFSNSLKSLSFWPVYRWSKFLCSDIPNCPTGSRKKEWAEVQTSANALSGGRKTGNLCWTCQDATWKKKTELERQVGLELVLGNSSIFSKNFCQYCQQEEWEANAAEHFSRERDSDGSLKVCWLFF